jgi:hypothetical protein
MLTSVLAQGYTKRLKNKSANTRYTGFACVIHAGQHIPCTV